MRAYSWIVPPGIAGPPRALVPLVLRQARHNYATIGFDEAQKRTQDQAITPCSCVSCVD